MATQLLGQYLTLKEFCTCTRTYRKDADYIDPYPSNPDETLPALEALCRCVVDPVIDEFGHDRFLLTYGFCSADLKRWLAKKDPATGKKHGIATPSLDQHMAHEVNRNGRYYCDRLGAACDFRILDLPSDALVDCIVAQRLPFDSLYFYGHDRPIHISYGPQHKRDIWGFTAKGTPTRRGTERWLMQIRTSKVF
ncbi:MULTISPECIES: hypothetical protein [Cyanophyceae]|uniref:hypothetical protein n=1 Tax=Cyanophyceae TaxID=3028117 RepID=UPI0016843B8F|nr:MULTISPECIES: hypothetical protein [Cyanophyceae]MBD1915384.1 hypothetical protein [Phormidium sp. FACHB-77]MBD2028949.1 hypothetical protein [Phormidium sp. FACHB-322]MBD2049396.1 hypothetical protein [Leptolyngbya sp. FACHB-60]